MVVNIKTNKQTNKQILQDFWQCQLAKRVKNAYGIVVSNEVDVELQANIV